MISRMKTPFRHPSEMQSPESREPISARIPTSLKQKLEKVAKENKLSLAELVSNVLEDYARWLEEEEK